MSDHTPRIDRTSQRSRRAFLRQSALIGGGALLSGSSIASPQRDAPRDPRENVESTGYAARDESGHLRPWTFERRSLRANDVLVDIKYAGVCHSDIHQLKGEWGPQQYPQVPGHEITGIVEAVGDDVTRFSVGDPVGVGTMVDSCGECISCRNGEEQHCDRDETLFTYGYPDERSPTGITQGGYATNIVVKEDFAIQIPQTIQLEHAAPLLCAGITTYSPMVQHSVGRDDVVGVAGIGGLGHLAVKLAHAQGAEVHAFTTTESKMEDARSFGASETVYVDSPEALSARSKSLDYMISTIPVDFNVGAYASLVKPHGHFTQVGMPEGGQLTINNFPFSSNRVNYNASLVGGIPQTQEIINYCAENEVHPEVEIIDAGAVNDAWEKVLAKDARYRYVIDAETI
jgi:alcohol dehydrogenase (NADP+)/uncharacterized zinc-type alcohol dehydrogenase-like protein